MGYRKAILKRLDPVRRQYFRDEPASVARAAKYLNLDPANAHDREKLLRILVGLTSRQPLRPSMRPNMESPTSSKSRRNMIFNWVPIKGTD